MKTSLVGTTIETVTVDVTQSCYGGYYCSVVTLITPFDRLQADSFSDTFVVGHIRFSFTATDVANSGSYKINFNEFKEAGQFSSDSFRDSFVDVIKSVPEVEHQQLGTIGGMLGWTLPSGSTVVSFSFREVSSFGIVFATTDRDMEVSIVKIRRSESVSQQHLSVELDFTFQNGIHILDFRDTVGGFDQIEVITDGIFPLHVTSLTFDFDTTTNTVRPKGLFRPQFESLSLGSDPSSTILPSDNHIQFTNSGNVVTSVDETYGVDAVRTDIAFNFRTTSISFDIYFDTSVDFVPYDVLFFKDDLLLESISEFQATPTRLVTSSESPTQLAHTVTRNNIDFNRLLIVSWEDSVPGVTVSSLDWIEYYFEEGVVPELPSGSQYLHFEHLGLVINEPLPYHSFHEWWVRVVSNGRLTDVETETGAALVVDSSATFLSFGPNIVNVLTLKVSSKTVTASIVVNLYTGLEKVDEIHYSFAMTEQCENSLLQCGLVTITGPFAHMEVKSGGPEEVHIDDMHYCFDRSCDSIGHYDWATPYQALRCSYDTCNPIDCKKCGEGESEHCSSCKASCMLADCFFGCDPSNPTNPSTILDSAGVCVDITQLGNGICDDNLNFERTELEQILLLGNPNYDMSDCQTAPETAKLCMNTDCDENHFCESCWDTHTPSSCRECFSSCRHYDCLISNTLNECLDSQPCGPGQTCTDSPPRNTINSLNDFICACDCLGCDQQPTVGGPVNGGCVVNECDLLSKGRDCLYPNICLDENPIFEAMGTRCECEPPFGQQNDVCSVDECEVSHLSDACTTGRCTDNDVLRLYTIECECEEGDYPACILDECEVGDRCPPEQICFDTSKSSTSLNDWVCVCAPPQQGHAVAAAAVCRTYNTIEIVFKSSDLTTMLSSEFTTNLIHASATVAGCNSDTPSGRDCIISLECIDYSLGDTIRRDQCTNAWSIPDDHNLFTPTHVPVMSTGDVVKFTLTVEEGADSLNSLRDIDVALREDLIGTTGPAAGVISEKVISEIQKKNILFDFPIVNSVGPLTHQTRCGLNQIPDSTGTSCLPCPVGTITDILNSNGIIAKFEQGSCLPLTPKVEQNEDVLSPDFISVCPPGTHSTGRGECVKTSCKENFHVVSHKCVACPKGSYRKAGDIAAGMDTECIEIRCAARQRVKDHECVPCPDTQTSDPGAAASGDDTNCVPWCSEVSCPEDRGCTSYLCQSTGYCKAERIEGCQLDVPCEACEGQDTPVCHKGVCVGDSCQFEPLSGTECDDSDPSTVNEFCEEGVCRGEVITCKSFNVAIHGEYCSPFVDQDIKCPNGVCSTELCCRHCDSDFATRHCDTVSTRDSLLYEEHSGRIVSIEGHPLSHYTKTLTSLSKIGRVLECGAHCDLDNCTAYQITTNSQVEKPCLIFTDDNNNRVTHLEDYDPTSSDILNGHPAIPQLLAVEEVEQTWSFIRPYRRPVTHRGITPYCKSGGCDVETCCEVLECPSSLSEAVCDSRPNCFYDATIDQCRESPKYCSLAGEYVASIRGCAEHQTTQITINEYGVAITSSGNYILFNGQSGDNPFQLQWDGVLMMFVSYLTASPDRTRLDGNLNWCTVTVTKVGAAEETKGCPSRSVQLAVSVSSCPADYPHAFFGGHWCCESPASSHYAVSACPERSLECSEPPCDSFTDESDYEKCKPPGSDLYPTCLKLVSSNPELCCDLKLDACTGSIPDGHTGADMLHQICQPACDYLSVTCKNAFEKCDWEGRAASIGTCDNFVKKHPESCCRLDGSLSRCKGGIPEGLGGHDTMYSICREECNEIGYYCPAKRPTANKIIQGNNATSEISDVPGESPYAVSYDKQKMQLLYTVDDLILAGVEVGSEIIKLAFYTTGQITITDYHVEVGWTTVSEVPEQEPIAKELITIKTKVDSSTHELSDGSWSDMTLLGSGLRWDGSSNLIIDICLDRPATTTHHPTVPTLISTTLFRSVFFNHHNSICPDSCEWCLHASEDNKRGSAYRRPLLRILTQKNAFSQCSLSKVTETTCSEYVANHPENCCSHDRTKGATLESCLGEIPWPGSKSSPIYQLCREECESVGESCKSFCPYTHPEAIDFGMICQNHKLPPEKAVCESPPCLSYSCEADNDIRCEGIVETDCPLPAFVFATNSKYSPFTSTLPLSEHCRVDCSNCPNDCSSKLNICPDNVVCTDPDLTVNGNAQCDCRCPTESPEEYSGPDVVCPNPDTIIRCYNHKRRGWCGHPRPVIDGELGGCVKVDEGETHTYESPFTSGDQCTCSNIHFSVGTCDDNNGWCLKKPPTPMPTPSPTPGPIVIDEFIVGSYIGLGRCFDFSNNYYSRLVFNVSSEKECHSTAIDVAATDCGVLGVEYAPPKCNVLAKKEISWEGGTWIDEDTAATTGVAGSEGATGEDTSTICWNYRDGPCGIADKCTCDKYILEETQERVLLGDSDQCTLTPDGTCKLDAQDCITCDDKASFLPFCPLLTSESPFTETDGGEIQININNQGHDYIILTDLPTCEIAGYQTITTVNECKQALCQTNNIEWLVNNFKRSSVRGCVSSTDSQQLFADAYLTDVVQGPEVNCIEAARLKQQCLCRRNRGSVIEIDASTCPTVDPEQFAEDVYTLQDTGYCGSTDGFPSYKVGDVFGGIKRVPRIGLIDITNHDECRYAACRLFGYTISGSLTDFGGYPISNELMPYTGSTDWTGGCSAQTDTHNIWFTRSEQETCAPNGEPSEENCPNGCFYDPATNTCELSRRPQNMCTSTTPCLCKKKLSARADFVVGIRIGLSEDTVNSMIDSPIKVLTGATQTPSGANSLRLLQSLFYEMFVSDATFGDSTKNTEMKMYRICFRTNIKTPLRLCRPKHDVTDALAAYPSNTESDELVVDYQGGGMFEIRFTMDLTEAVNAKDIMDKAVIDWSKFELNNFNVQAVEYVAVVEPDEPVADPLCVATTTTPCFLPVDFMNSGVLDKCDACAEIPCTSDYDVTYSPTGERIESENCDEIVVTLAAFEERMLTFGSLAATAEASAEQHGPKTIYIKKTPTSGSVRIGVRIGKNPNININADPSETHYRSSIENDGEDIAILKACGPFAVGLAASGVYEMNSVNLTVCYPRAPCPHSCIGQALDGNAYGSCVLADPWVHQIEQTLIPSLQCKCKEGFGIWKNDVLDCRKCSPGLFPQPGSSSGIEPCSMRCMVNSGGLPHGYLEDEADHCTCIGGWTGIDCSICPSLGASRYGKFCNETRTPLRYNFNKTLTISDRFKFSPPPWKVTGPDFALLTVKSSEYITTLTLTAQDSLSKDTQQTLSNQFATSPGVIDSMYYGYPPFPAPCATGGMSQNSVYLHVLMQSHVKVYSVSNGEFTLVCSAAIQSYYESWKIANCRSPRAFGEQYAEDIETATFYNDPSGKGAHWLIFTKQNRVCAAVGAAGSMIFRTDAESRELFNLFDVPSIPVADSTDATSIGTRYNIFHPAYDRSASCTGDNGVLANSLCVRPDPSYTWDDIEIINGNLHFFKYGKETRIFNQLSTYCCDDSRTTCMCGSQILDRLDSDRPATYTYPAGTARPVSFKVLYINEDVEVVGDIFKFQAAGNLQAVASGSQFGSAQYPTLYVSEYVVIVDNNERLIADVLPGIDFPAKITAAKKFTATTVATSNTKVLRYDIFITDPLGKPVELSNDRVAVHLQRCASPLNEEQIQALEQLKSVVTDESKLQEYLLDENDCEDTTEQWISGGLYGSELVERTTSIEISDIAVSHQGWYRLVFTHVKSGLNVTTDTINIITERCPEDSTAADPFTECFEECLIHESRLSAVCNISIGSNKEWVTLYAEAVSHARMEFQIEKIIQPCCYGNGLCCAGIDSCSGHTLKLFNTAEAIKDEKCDCHESVVDGFYDQRAQCSSCKTGFTGPKCTLDDTQPYVEPVIPKFDLLAGEQRFFVFSTQGETSFNLGISTDNEQEDADVTVTFVSCPGQNLVGAIPRNVISIPCNGRGICSFETDGTTKCHCYPKYEGNACEEICCGGRGICEDLVDPSTQLSSRKCSRCYSDFENGYWEHSDSFCDNTDCGSGGSVSYPVSDCILRTSYGAYLDCGIDELAVEPATEQFVSWKGLTTPGDIHFAGIKLSNIDGEYLNKVFVIQATVTPTDTTYPPPVTPEGSLCGITYNSGDVVCVPNSIWEPSIRQCTCHNDYICKRGVCTQRVSPDGVTQACGVPTRGNGCNKELGLFESNGLCECAHIQHHDDQVTHYVCESGMCIPMIILSHMWTSEDFLKNETDIDLLYATIHPQGRYFTPAGRSETRSNIGDGALLIDITSWMQTHVSFSNYKTFDLSFVITAETSSGSTTLPIIPTADLVMKKGEKIMKERLFYSTENSLASDKQNGHPYYSMKIASVIEDDDNKAAFDMLQYNFDNVERSEGRCESPDGDECECDPRTVYQDAVDFTQIDNVMYFLAVTDWESQRKTSAPCQTLWGDNSTLFQGARELFYSTAGPDMDLKHTMSPKVQHLGLSEFPDFEEPKQTKLRDDLTGMRVFTRAKDLSSFRGTNPNLHERILTFTGVAGSGAASTVRVGASEQETHLSLVVPQVWMITLSKDEAKPVSVPELLVTNVIFPSYTTEVVLNGEHYLFMLGEEETELRKPSIRSNPYRVRWVEAHE
eukprot:TRINITY_DN10584_c0_g1_i3.p1 TRINITY_DN10584_c0_g1~~TRINITY_DN10584_c0_g1_i3.p1  ORF type:complete len:5406 (+),score=909.69 TRINITY_DN10584_c0_g1_i3:2367-16220(+)